MKLRNQSCQLILGHYTFRGLAISLCQLRGRFIKMLRRSVIAYGLLAYAKLNFFLKEP